MKNKFLYIEIPITMYEITMKIKIINNIDIFAYKFICYLFFIRLSDSIQNDKYCVNNFIVLNIRDISRRHMYLQAHADSSQQQYNAV